MSALSKLSLLCVIALMCVFCASCDNSKTKSNTNKEQVTNGEISSIDPFDDALLTEQTVNTTEFTAMAEDLYLAGEHFEAARYYIAALKVKPGDSSVLYNLACCYGLLGKGKFAAVYLRRAFDAGFTDIQHMMQDSDFTNVRDDADFKQAFDKILADSDRREKTLGQTVNIEATALFRCRVHLPSDYSPDNKYKLLVGLHGWGDKHENFIRMWRGFEKDQFIYAAPQAPYPFGDPGEVGYSWTCMTPEGEGDFQKSAIMTIDYVASVVEYLKQRYSVSEVYLMGFSQGATFTYLVGLNHPKLFSAIFPIGGWLEKDAVSDDLLNGAKSLKVRILHGLKDDRVPHDAAVNALDVLTTYGYDVSLFDYDEAHTITLDCLRAIEKWMIE